MSDGSSARDDNPFLQIVRGACRAAAWLVEPGGPDDWTRAHPIDAELPSQGWKLHVSATVASAEEVLRVVLPVLIDNAAPFKVAGSPSMLAALNEGSLGLSQIGKFLTIYPLDDSHAVRVASILHVATRGRPGPVVPSDRPLCRGSLVSYRYGGFSTALLQTCVGEVLPSLVGVDGRLHADRRELWYTPPEGRADPFAQLDLGESARPPTLIVGDRYVLSTVVQQSPRGTVYLALDTHHARRVIVKMARRGSLGGDQGRDARDRLRAEAGVLAALSPHWAIPTVYDLIDEHDSLSLVMEDIEGETIEQHVLLLLARGRFVTPSQAIAWGRQLAAILDHIHQRGYVYRDLKSPNVIIGPDSRVRLVDFDMAQPVDDIARPYGKGTRGYYSPQQQAGEPPRPTDDIYGMGALLYFVLTGAEPSRAPAEFALGARPVETLNPAVGAELADAIAHCLALMPRERYPTMEAVDSALARAEHDASTRSHPRLPSESAARREAREGARRLASTICNEARPAPHGDGIAWATRHPMGMGRILTRDINIGTAGTLLALADLAAEFDAPQLFDTTALSARWLVVAPPFAGDPLAGLYVGEAGVGAALLRAGQILGDPSLIDAAADRGRRVSAMPYNSPDLFNGTAGRLRFHLWLWDETHEQEHLDAAMAARSTLLDQAERDEHGNVRWLIPAGYGSMSGTAMLGYAHGAAGIADAMLDLYEVTGDADAADAATGVAHWLASLAEPSLEDGTGRTWPAIEGVEVGRPWWCHGSTGIGRFFLRVAALGLVPEAESLAIGAARMVAQGGRGLSASQCHGLAGNIDFLLDVYRATSDENWLRDARMLANLMDAHAAEVEGNFVYAAETPGVFTPDYMVGYAGVAVTLLRLADPESRPIQLSLEGFRRRP